MKKVNRKLVIVLGMHRSGTSVITRALEVMGVDLGNNLMPAIPGVNEKGFWEDLEIFSLNEEMLHCLSSSWHSLLPINMEGVEKLNRQGFLIRAIDLLIKKMKDIQVLGIKDPRLPKLLPFWQQVFTELSLDVRYVIALRNPLSVAYSLKQRDGFPLEKGLLMWVDHMVASLYFTKGTQRVIGDYDLLMYNPNYVITKIARVVELEVSQKKLIEFTDSFLDHGLQHKKFVPNDLQKSFVPNIVRDIYQELMEIQTNESYFDNFDFIDSRVESWYKFVYSQADSWELVNLISQQLAERDTQLAQRDIQLAQQDAQLVQRDAQLAQRDAQLTEQDRILREITSSKSWKIAMVIGRIRMWVIPSGSIRARIFEKLLSFFYIKV